MNQSDFVKMGSFFEAISDGIKVRISDHIMSDGVVQLAEKVLSEYPQKITAIAEHISKDEWIATTYKLSKEEIAEKLHLPNILMWENGGRLAYVNNEIDYSHILDVEFSGALDVLYDVGMDG